MGHMGGSRNPVVAIGRCENRVQERPSPRQHWRDLHSHEASRKPILARCSPCNRCSLGRTVLKFPFREQTPYWAFLRGQLDPGSARPTARGRAAGPRSRRPGGRLRLIRACAPVCGLFAVNVGSIADSPGPETAMFSGPPAADIADGINGLVDRGDAAESGDSGGQALYNFKAFVTREIASAIYIRRNRKIFRNGCRVQ